MREVRFSVMFRVRARVITVNLTQITLALTLNLTSLKQLALIEIEG